MLRRVLRAARLALAVQARSRFPQIYFGVALATVLVFRFTPAAAFAEVWIPAFLLGEPGTLGIYLVAAHRYLERNERSDLALVVTPLRPLEAALGLVLATALLGTGAGLLVYVGSLGLDGAVLALALPLFLTVTLSGLLGVALAGVFSEFTRFLIGSIVPVTVYSLPFAAHFGLLPRAATLWVPSDPALGVFGALARGELGAGDWALQTAALAVWNLVGVAWIAARTKVWAEAP